MRGDPFRRAIGVAVADAGEDLAVFLERDRRGVVQRHQPQPVGMGLGLADDLVGMAMADQLAHPLVKAVIQVVKAVAVAGRDRGRLRLEDRVEFGQVGLGQHPGGFAHHRHLDRRPHEARALDHGGRDPGHRGGALRLDLQEPQLRETEEGVAHRLARHAQLPRHVQFRQLGAGGQLDQQHLPVQRLEHLIGDRGAGDRLHIAQRRMFGHPGFLHVR